MNPHYLSEVTWDVFAILCLKTRSPGKDKQATEAEESNLSPIKYLFPASADGRKGLDVGHGVGEYITGRNGLGVIQDELSTLAAGGSLCVFSTLSKDGGKRWAVA